MMRREKALEKANFPDKLPLEPAAWIIAMAMLSVPKKQPRKGVRAALLSPSE